MLWMVWFLINKFKVIRVIFKRTGATIRCLEVHLDSASVTLETLRFQQNL